MRTGNDRPRAFAGHLLTACCFGVVGGVTLLVAEAVIPYRGHYSLLGDSLARVVFVYLVSFIAAGTVFGLVVATPSVLAGRLLRPAGFVRFYAGAWFFLAASFWYLRNHPLSAIRRLWASPDMLFIVAFLLAAAAVAMAAGRIIAPKGRPPRTKHLVPPTAASVLLALVLFLTQRGSEFRLPQPPADPSAGPNVVFIVLDALRADHLSAYGYERPTSPNMDRVAAEGVVFLNARSHGNRTVLAMPAIFTSLYPSFHGAISRGELMSPLPDDRVTIAELFQRANYTSVGLMTNIYLKSAFGMTQGFDRVEEFNAGCYALGLYKLLRKLNVLGRPEYASTGSPGAAALTDRGLAWLDHLQDRPFFLYMHYMDTHHPYVAPEEFERRIRPSTDGPDAAELFIETLQLLKAGRPQDLDPERLEALRDYYDATILYADHEIGRILDRVRQISQERETIVIITADHGDEFLEHGSLYHTNLVIEGLIRVPLIVWDPARYQGGRRVESLVRHIDILPTLAGIIGQPVPQEAMGQSLEPLLTGETRDLELASISEGDFCAALVERNWKVMYVDSTDTAYLYDLDKDPQEYRDLSASEPEVMADLMRRLDLYLEKAQELGHQAESLANPEIIRQLKALGYL
ncbi:MAG: sulfatase [Candidatus Krumholzibacteria bacterium]